MRILLGDLSGSPCIAGKLGKSPRGRTIDEYGVATRRLVRSPQVETNDGKRAWTSEGIRVSG